MLKRNPNYTKFDPRTAQVMCLIMLIVIFVGLLIGCKSTEKQDIFNGEMDIMADIKKVDMGAY